MIQASKQALEVGRKVEQRIEIRMLDEYDVVAAGRLGVKVLVVECKNFVGRNTAVGLQILGTHTIPEREWRRG